MKLFLSYATENRPVAEEIYFALTGADHEVFFDQPSLQPGDNYTARIRKAIDAADGMIFLISPHSIVSGNYTLTELKFAREKWEHPERRVLSVIVEPTRFETIPVYLKAVTILQPAGNAAAEVVESLRQWGKSVPVAGRRQHNFSLEGLIILLSSGVLIAVTLGTVFSMAYPRVAIGLNLALLLTLVGMLLAFSVRGIWRFVRRKYQ